MEILPTSDTAKNKPALKTVSPSIKSLTKTSEKILSSDTPLEFIEKAGIDLLEIYKGLGDIALHASIAAKDRDGDIIDMGPDNRSRIMASTLLLELAKHIKDKSIVTQVGIFNDPKIVEEANRVLALRGKL